MPRIPKMPPRPEPCPPHDWVQVDDPTEYRLQCTKQPDHIWPDPRDRRDR